MWYDKTLGMRIFADYVESTERKDSLYTSYRGLVVRAGENPDNIAQSLEFVRAFAAVGQGGFSGLVYRRENIILHMRLFQKRLTPPPV